MHLQWIIYERNIEVSFHHGKAFRYCNFFLLSAIIYDFWDLYKTDKTGIKFVSYHISCIMYISEIWYNLSKYIYKLYKQTILFRWYLNVLSLYLSMYEIWIWYLLLINHILTRAKLFDAGLKLSPSYLLWKYNLIFPRIALLFTYLHKRYEFISSLYLPQGMYKPLCKYEDIYVQLKAY